MSKPARRRGLQWLALLYFAALALLHLYPLSLHPADTVVDAQDGLLTTWILHWVQTHGPSPAALFEANAFHPHSGVLSFSEHFIPLAVLSLPLHWLTRNPVLVYNSLFLLAFVLNGFFTHILVRRLTGSFVAGLTAGTIFAFGAYPMMHLPHLQLLSAWFMPLAFFFLHRFFERRRTADALLFAGCFTLQGLTSVYYALFFISILAVVLPVFFWAHRAAVRPKALLPLGGALLAAAAILFVFSLPYSRLMETYGFHRPIYAGAELSNYLAPAPGNVLLGPILGRLSGLESCFLPGLAALVLAVLFVARRREAWTAVPRGLRVALASAAAAAAAASAAVLATGGFRLDLGLFTIIGDRLDWTTFLAAVCGLLLVLSSLLFLGLKGRTAALETRIFMIYGALGLWALLLSFGGDFVFFGRRIFEGRVYEHWLTPFRWLYGLMPPFRGIREPGRYGVFVLFAVAVLAGFGVRAAAGAFRRRGPKIAAAAGLLIFLSAEYWTGPKPVFPIPAGRDVPPTYDWLRENGSGGGAVLELPFLNPVSWEAVYMYFSCRHGRPLVNGYSGFLPPAINYVRDVFRSFPNWECLEIMSAFGVRHLVLHERGYGRDDLVYIEERLARDFAGQLEPVRTFEYALARPFERRDVFGEDTIYELRPRRLPRPAVPETAEVPPEFWRLRSNFAFPELTPLTDRNPESRWATPRGRRTHDFLEIALDRPRPVARVSLELHPADVYDNYAFTLGVETSLDGESWTPHEFSYAAGEFALGLVRDPLHPAQNLYLDGRPVRFVRLHQYGDKRAAPWRVAEIRVFEAAAMPAPAPAAASEPARKH